MSEITAIALLLDSSMSLASNWNMILQNYISPVLSGIIGPRPNPSVVPVFQTIYMAVVTYATSDILPTPIIAKRYFSSPSPISKELKDHPQQLGIGKTGSGGKGGMAALEGYVAVLEMFDMFVATHPENNVTSQMIHITATLPDSAQVPLWNYTPALDNASWQTLPEELRKRNIRLNMVLLRAAPQYLELHSSVVAKPRAPWFPVPAEHTLLLSGIPAPHEANSTTKRAGDSMDLDRSADQKRPRTVSQNSTQDLLSLSSGIPQAPKAVTPGAPSMQPTLKTVIPQIVAANMPAAAVAMIQKIQELEHSIKAEQPEYQLAVRDGRVEDVKRIKESLEKNTHMFKQYKALFTQMAMKRASAGSNVVPLGGNDAGTSAADVGNKLSGGLIPADASGSGTGPTSAQPEISSIEMPNMTQSTQGQGGGLLQSMPPQQGLLPGGAGMQLPGNVHPDVALQMQKLLAQQRNRLPQQTSPQPNMNNNNSYPMQPQQPGLPLNNTPEQQSWQGSFTWSGSDPLTGAKKDVSAQVVVARSTGGNLMAETWPSNLTLSPSRETNVPAADVQAWMKKYMPTICQIRAQLHVADEKTNSTNFRQLHKMLLERKMHGTTMWQLPNGRTDYTMVIIAVPNPLQSGNVALAAAVFPETGVPEFPKASNPNNQVQSQGPQPGTQPQVQPNLNQAFSNTNIAQQLPPWFSALGPQQKQEVASQLISKRREMQLQQHQQQMQGQNLTGNQRQQQPPHFSQQDLNAFMAMNANTNQNAVSLNNMSALLSSGLAGNNVQALANYMGGQGFNNNNNANMSQANFGFPQQQQQGQQQNGGPMGMPNLSMEMFQSFVQRNPEGMGPS